MIGTALLSVALVIQPVPTQGWQPVLPTLRPNLVAYYDFEHPVPGDVAQE